MHILTFDIEAWYYLYNHPERFLRLPEKRSPGFLEKETTRIFHFLEERDLKATFFWLGADAKPCSSLVRKLHDSGHEIGVHSFFHAKIGAIDPGMFRSDTERAVKTLEDITGEKIKSYRAPIFSLTDESLWALEILHSLGIENDSSMVTGRQLGSRRVPSQPFLISNKGMVMKEFPVTAFQMYGFDFRYSGSGFFRIAPYRFLHRKMTASGYVMSYFHPRDFDLHIHRKIKWNPYLKFKYRIGAKRAFDNMGRLSEENRWTSLRDSSQSVDWNMAEVMNLKG